MQASELTVRVDLPLPDSLPVGRGTALLCLGACFHPRERIRALELLVDGRSHAPDAQRMPRLDLFQALPEADANSYRGGFWGIVPVEARAKPGEVRVEVAARLASGERLVAPYGALEVTDAAPPERDQADGLIAVCMATFDPDMELFRQQVESLRAQTDERWTCVVSDDHSDERRFEELRAAIADDERFVVSRAGERRGPYRNFARALSMAPADACLIALCDQDDRWYPDKLATLRAGLGRAQLVFSDQRLVDRDGNLLRESLWSERRNEHANLASLVVANAVTGSAALFRREVAELALPFPAAPGWVLHDHWIALVALATGEIAYVDRPLYDYVQHGRAVVGHGSPAGRSHSRGWRAAYFYGYLPRRLLAATLLSRCGRRLTARKRRALRLFADADRGRLGLAWLAARPLRRLFGRNETLGTESELARGIAWRHLVRLRTGRRERPGGLALDASCPPLDATTLGDERLAHWRRGP